MASPLGEKIKNLRIEKGLSLEQLAQMTDSSKSYLWELENREQANPSLEKILEYRRRHHFHHDP